MYGAVAITLLGLRYWVLPHIDNWRPQIEHYASEALGARVTIDRIQADWRGLNPQLRLEALAIHDRQNAPVLTLPSVSAVLGWRSVLALEPQLLSLKIERPELRVRRDAANRLWVAGQAIDLNADDGLGIVRSPVLRWLVVQREIVLLDAQVHWLDEVRQAPEIVLRDVSARLRNGSMTHRFAFSAAPPADLARAIALCGVLTRTVSGPADARGWRGELYAELDNAQPSAWQAWLPAPDVAGRATARAWLDLDAGQATGLTLDAALRDVSWQAADGATSVAVAAGTLRLDGAPGDLVQFADLPLARSDAQAGMALQARITDARFSLPQVFDPPSLHAGTLQVDASLSRRQGRPATLEVRQLAIVNEDLQADLHGRWIQEGKTAAGTADFQGTLVRAAMPAIYRYLPLAVDADARQWLAYGLPAGQARDAAVTVRGDLDDFPFNQPGDTGQFRIAGHYTGAIVDYAPAQDGRKAWPRLENLAGTFAVDKVSLTLASPGGAVAHTGRGHSVQLGTVSASIPDMENEARLHVDGLTSGPVPAYLALAANSPLGALLDGALDTAEGSGMWQVSLKLDVPLQEAENTRVDGRIVFSDDTFRFLPEMPWLSKLHGVLQFSELGLRADGLRAEFLGGPAHIVGKLEDARDRLHFEGTLAAAALEHWAQAPAMSRLSGRTAYRGQLAYAPGGQLDIAVESDLAGLAIDMPAPVGKARAAVRPLKVQWGPAQGGPSRRLLSIALDSDVAVLLERTSAARGATYFTRGALGVNRNAVLPAAGLSVDVSLPGLDLDAWEKVADAFSRPGSRGAKRSNTVLPRPNRISLASQHMQTRGWTLDNVTLNARRPVPNQWRVELDSRQAAGSLSWQEASGAIAGQITARLTHLSLGEAAENTEAGAPASSGTDLSDIPAIDLQAQQFTLYGREVGALEVLGTNQERGAQWRLDKLRISNEAAVLDATGSWRLDGAQRGLTVDAAVQFKNLGGFMDRIGYKQMVTGGHGSIKGKLNWRDLPWTHDLANLQGEVRISLDKGRFLHVSSRSARLLELLSLQSLQRLAKLEFNPANLVRDGFPFDTIRGDMKLDKGVVHTEGYKLNGPVAAIVLAGDADIIAERWDMKAVVIPNLDASGAAVVTALAVNPLIGLGAFVTQWLLQRPLARAMTMEYAVTGTWDEPKIEAAQAQPPRAPTPSYVEP